MITALAKSIGRTRFSWQLLDGFPVFLSRVEVALFIDAIT